MISAEPITDVFSRRAAYQVQVVEYPQGSSAASLRPLSRFAERAAVHRSQRKFHKPYQACLTMLALRSATPNYKSADVQKIYFLQNLLYQIAQAKS